MSMITVDRSVVEQALETLNSFEQNYGELWQTPRTAEQLDSVAVALRAALEQPQGEQEPFAVLVRKHSWHLDTWEVGPHGNLDYGRAWADERINVYTRPQPPRQPSRQPLTDVQVHAIWDRDYRGWFSREQIEHITRAIERAHGIGGEA